MNDLRTLCTELLERLKLNVRYEEPAQDYDLDEELIEKVEAFLAEPAVDSGPLEELRQIGYLLRTQDNRITQDPIFQVRGKERVYGMDLAYTDDFIWVDDEHNPVEVPEDADSDGPPEGVTVLYYITVWRILAVAFTEEGCKHHLRLNGHNYRNFDEVQIWADSLYRCPEMIAIRKALMALPPPEEVKS